MNMSIIRGLIKAVRAAKSKDNPPRFDASGRTDEEFTDREMFQQYGFASRPPAGTQCLLVKSGQNVYMVASDGSKYGVDLKDGEVALSDKHGNRIHLQEGGKIVIKATSKVEVNSENVLVEGASEVKVKSNKAIIDSGDINLGPEALMAFAGGVVTTMCLCSISGAPHPIGSSTVQAAT
jgi:phage gp45-like